MWGGVGNFGSPSQKRLYTSWIFLGKSRNRCASSTGRFILDSICYSSVLKRLESVRVVATIGLENVHPALNRLAPFRSPIVLIQTQIPTLIFKIEG